MSKNKKLIAGMSKTAMAAVFASTIVSSTAFAAADSIVLNNQGTSLEYGLTNLGKSYLGSLGYGDTSKALYQDYAAKITAGATLTSIHDDKGYYVDYAKLVSAFISSPKTFNLDTATGSAAAADKVTPANVSTVTLNADGTVKVTPVATALTVSSVSAINKTQINVVFNQAVDSVAKENFAVDGGVTVTNAKLSDDRKSVTLDLSGVNWATSYNVTVKNVLVNGTKAADVTGSFKSIAVSEAYDLKITSKAASITASTGDNTVLTFQLLDKTTGVVDKNANNVVLSIATTYGTLANTKLTVQNGEATVLLAGEYSASQVIAKIDAQIIEASGDYKDLIGKVTGTLNVPFVPQGTNTGDVVNKPILVSAGASQADRVILYFNKDVSVDDFVAKDSVTGKYVVDANGNAKLTTGTSVIISNNSDLTGAKTVRGFKAVAGNTKAIEVILDKANYLTDNSTVFVKANISSTGNSANANFILTDARRPEPVSVGVTGLKTINVNYSESIVAPATSQVLVDAGKYTVVTSTVGDFDQVTGTDSRNVLTVKTKEYMTSGTHSIQLAGISDFAGKTDVNNICTTQTLGFDVAQNDLAPTATVSVESPEQFRVKFNTAVAYKNAQGLEISDLSQDTSWVKLMRLNTSTGKYDKDAAILADVVTPTGSTQGLVVTRVSDSEYVVEVTQDWTKVYDTINTNKNYYNDKYELLLAKGTTVDANKVVTDGLFNPANGKAIQADLALDINYTGSAMNSNDTVSPVISAIQRIDTTNNFNVLMTKPVKLTGKDNAGDTQSQLQGASIPATIVEFQGKDKDGNTVTLKGSIVSYNSDNKDDKTFEVNLPNIQSLVDAGYDTNWTLIVRSISDDVGNTAATLTKDFTVAKSTTAASVFRVVDADNDKTNGADGIKVKLYNGDVLNPDTSDKIFITFTEGVQYTGTTNNATNVANYTLNGDPLPKATSIQLAKNPDGTINDKTIVITLPDRTLNAAQQNSIVLNKSLQAANSDTLTWEHEFVLPVAVDNAGYMPWQVVDTVTNSLAGAANVSVGDNNTITATVTNPTAKIADLVGNLSATTVANIQSIQLVGTDGKVAGSLDTTNVAAAKNTIQTLFGKDATTVTLQDVISKGYKLTMNVDGDNFTVILAQNITQN